MAIGDLTDRQVAFFRAQGFLRLPVEVDEVTLERCRARVASLCDEEAFEDKGPTLRFSSAVEREECFLELAESPVLLGALRSLLGTRIELLLNRHNHVTITKPRASPRRLHRDILQWSRSVVTAIVYLEPSSWENGCTEVVPGSHYLPFVRDPNNGGTWMDEHPEYSDLLGQAVPVPMPAGGVLLLDSLAFHSPGANLSASNRAVVVFGFHSSDELQSIEDPTRRLIAGKRIYKGNDRPARSLTPKEERHG